MNKVKQNWHKPVTQLLASARLHRLLVWSVVLTVACLVVLQSGVSITTKQNADIVGWITRLQELNDAKLSRQPDNQPETARPLLMPWRGPVRPMPLEPGAAAVVYNIPTSDPVVFLTIDDGVVQNPEAGEWLEFSRLPFTLFLDDHAIRNNYGYFKRLTDAGMNVQNHTVNHARLKKLSFDGQKAEICGASDIFANVFGQRPVLFRPPYGQFNDDTRRAVLDCGMRAIVMWRAVVEKGHLHYQFGKTHLEAGDIVLMHFTKNFMADIEAFTAQANSDHLRIGRLEDWLK
ncbi:hypothetical protein A2884_02450 [Candidatus Saccharibacteria bacterium RIFCSPHIGHO2_01_FULL_48_12]|nr:MAG: hypothetical protein A2884_02450 [Candidatus Saccharibacteria bacterium RIFCSPHIGHO2_01_FULL_48_12]OGL34766.1 MAG: hypothetical protein A3F38_00960 [Candidatus Saccharibacteria bacterium RIFCSPHIGHO2_12_FULL_48_21]